jgi:mono/diheme cytochrome c family protein
MARNPAKGVQVFGAAMLASAASSARAESEAAMFMPEEQAVLAHGRTIYTETCAACHADDGRGAPAAAPGPPRAPSLAGSPRVLGHRDYVVHGLLHGITGPVDGQRFTDVMIPMGSTPDDWIAAVSSYVRNAFGNRASLVTAADVARVRAASSGRTSSWTVEEIDARLPKPLVADSRWKLTASHNAALAPNALGLVAWTSGAPQEPGMWLQLELPEPVMLTEIQFSAESAFARGGGGGRGRGAPLPGTTPMSPATAEVLATGGYPRGYQLQVSMDGAVWSAPVAEGRGAPRSTVISFSPVRARFARITQTATTPAAPAWVVTSLRLYEAGPGAP